MSISGSQQHPTGLPRRTFLRTATAAAGSAALVSATAKPAFAARTGSGFLHSVASGDPTPNRVIIWTRVTPEPRATPGSGYGKPTTVRWEVARTKEFHTVDQSGSFTTNADRDHTVKVDVTGLSPSTRYFYRFTVTSGNLAGTTSPVGRTKTAPPLSQSLDRLRFAVCSCANYEAGYFTAYRAMAEHSDLDFILHLGDYTYEYETGGYVGAYSTKVRQTAPVHATVTVDDYRIRQGRYHQDPDLQRAHEAHPFICMWDDHESADNSYRDGAKNHDPATQGSWSARKRASDKAYFEWMPVRPNSIDNGEHLYRRFRFGTLAELIIPDLRSYRARQSALKTEDPRQTLTGATQYRWLEDSVTTSSAHWQVIGSEVMMAPVVIPANSAPQVADFLHSKIGTPLDGIPLNSDQWDGYAAERRKLLTAIDNAGKRNVVVVTGDIHSAWASEVPKIASHYGQDGSGRAIACEFVVPSITAASGYDTIALTRELGAPTDLLLQTAQAAVTTLNPWIKMSELKSHGFGILTVTPQQTGMDWYFIDNILHRQSNADKAFSWHTKSGTPRLVRG